MIPPVPRALIQELADYEKMPDGPRITAEQLEKDGFGPHKFFHCEVAEADGEVGATAVPLLAQPSAAGVCPLLLHLLHLGGQVCLHGGLVRPAQP